MQAKFKPSRGSKRAKAWRRIRRGAAPPGHAKYEVGGSQEAKKRTLTGHGRIVRLSHVRLGFPVFKAEIVKPEGI